MNDKASPLSLLLCSFLVYCIHSVAHCPLHGAHLGEGLSTPLTDWKVMGSMLIRQLLYFTSVLSHFSLQTDSINCLQAVYSVRVPQDINLLHHSPDDLTARY